MANKMIIDASHPEETRVVVLRGNRVEEFDFEFSEQEAAAGQYLPRQGYPGRAVAPGRFRRLWRQPARLSRFLRNPSGLLPNSGRRSAGASRGGSPVPARGGRRGQRRTTQPASSAPAAPRGRSARRGRARRFRNLHPQTNWARTNPLLLPVGTADGELARVAEAGDASPTIAAEIDADPAVATSGGDAAETPGTEWPPEAANDHFDLSRVGGGNDVLRSTSRGRGSTSAPTPRSRATKSSTKRRTTRMTITKSRRSRAAPRSA